LDYTKTQCLGKHCFALTSCRREKSGVGCVRNNDIIVFFSSQEYLGKEKLFFLDVSCTIRIWFPNTVRLDSWWSKVAASVVHPDLSPSFWKFHGQDVDSRSPLQIRGLPYLVG
jgi:hypothetical protein